MKTLFWTIVVLLLGLLLTSLFLQNKEKLINFMKMMVLNKMKKIIKINNKI